MSTPTEALGIFQSDILIRHALLEGLRFLRANAWALDAVTRWLKFDDLTSDRYGQKEIENFKKWFKGQEIAVVTYGSITGPIKSPSITIALVNSNEEDNTLGDIHYVPQEDVAPADAPWPALSDPFVPLCNAQTGQIIVPVTVSTDIYPGMVIVDAQGVAHEILTVTAENTFTIAPGVFDFRNAVLKAGSPAYLQTLESAKFSETYQIGCHVDGDPAQLPYLHSIAVFILLWGRQDLLEGRGFEKSKFTSSDFAKEDYFNVENMFSRYITLTGTVQHCWPKRQYQKLTGVRVVIQPIGSGNLPPDMQPVSDQLWIGDKDSIG